MKIEESSGRAVSLATSMFNAVKLDSRPGMGSGGELTRTVRTSSRTRVKRLGSRTSSIRIQLAEGMALPLMLQTL